MRCKWPKTLQEKQYHDLEWCVPIYEDNRLFECLTLEGAQAGLSWSKILAKRENYRKAFDNFQIEKVASYTEDKIIQLLDNKGIIRNKLKIQSVVSNAICMIEIQKEYGSFSSFIWSFVEGKTIHNQWKCQMQVPSRTDLSDKISKILKGRGFKFVGSIICYSFMQAIGIVNDHTIDCVRYNNLMSCKNSKF